MEEAGSHSGANSLIYVILRRMPALTSTTRSAARCGWMTLPLLLPVQLNDSHSDWHLPVGHLRRASRTVL